MRTYTRAASLVAALVLAFVNTLCATQQAEAQGTTASISGRVLDANTGLPLANVTIAAQGPITSETHTDDNGSFAFPKLDPGQYVLVARLPAYQSTQSEPIATVAGLAFSATLTLRRLQTGTDPQVIGRTSTSRTTALQNASVVSKSVTMNQVQDSGYYRVADALKTLPGVIVSGAQTSAPADDIKFTIRGIGTLETLTLIDGHPIAQGLPGGFSYNLSPTVALRDATVIYGSGSDLFPVAAIGGIINLQTVEPSRTPQATISLNYGTYMKTGFSMLSTGPITDHFSYAIGLSSQGTDGLYRNAKLYNFSAVNGDPSGGPGTPGYQSGVYNVDTSSNSKTAFGKLRYQFDPNTRLTVSALSTGFYDDKTGNGDLDYQTNEFTVANGATAGSGGCPANQYPTGGTPPCLAAGAVLCVLRRTQRRRPGLARVALLRLQRNAGKQGRQRANQRERVHQRPGLALRPHEPTTVLRHTGRQPDDARHLLVRDRRCVVRKRYRASTIRSRSARTSRSSPTRKRSWSTAVDPTTKLPVSTNVYGNNVVNENSFYLRDAYQFDGLPLTLFANGWLRHSSATSTTNFDPRLALVFTPAGTVIRIAAGMTTTQPDLSTSAPFTPVPLGSLVGAHGSVVSIGSIPASGLRPERGTDVELGIGRRFGRNSLIQGTLYATNVANKIYSTKIKASALPPGTISPAILATYGNYLAGLGVTGAVGVTQAANLGQVLAQGIELNGVQELSSGFRFDYDYATESTKLVGAATTILKSNLNLIPGSQLPNVPLHRYNLGLAWRSDNVGDVTARLGYHHESENNPRNLPAYGYYDFGISAKVGRGRVAIFVDNLFNQYADYRGLEFSGFPNALNAFADPSPGADYAAQIGAAATERFGLPFRTINLTYTLRAR